jgi:hypothetical protein
MSSTSGSLLESAYHKWLRERGENYDTGFVGCSCSRGIRVEPGSRRVVDQGTLNEKGISYDVPPGKYTIREGLEANTPSEPVSHIEHRAYTSGLAITVTDQ